MKTYYIGWTGTFPIAKISAETLAKAKVLFAKSQNVNALMTSGRMHSYNKIDNQSRVYRLCECTKEATKGDYCNNCALTIPV